MSRRGRRRRATRWSAITSVFVVLVSFVSSVTFVSFVVIALVAMTASPAPAHTDLLQASPGPDDRVGGTVDFVDLVFTDPVTDAVVVVTGPDGEAVAGETLVDEGHLVRHRIAPLTIAGRYRVDYNMTSADGDHTEAGFDFTYDRGASTPGRLSPGTVPDAGGIPPGLAGGIGAVVALIAVIGLLEWRRRPRRYP